MVEWIEILESARLVYKSNVSTLVVEWIEITSEAAKRAIMAEGLHPRGGVD